MTNELSIHIKDSFKRLNEIADGIKKVNEYRNHIANSHFYDNLVCFYSENYDYYLNDLIISFNYIPTLKESDNHRLNRY